ncbi:hypothetical protein O3P69_009270 [Scylla paramamosain]|uniref:Tachykinin n=1 Tax=Scylla paramamosain TaxID=85552 RepID=A0AAW0TBN2_SCYPA
MAWMAESSPGTHGRRTHATSSSSHLFLPSQVFPTDLRMSRMWVWAAMVVVGVAAVAAASGAGQGEAGSDAPRPRRAPSGFLGMRGKKEAPSPPLQDAPAPPEDLLPALYQLDVPLRGKKAPSGFLGMRGKKSEEEEEEDEETPFARPSYESEFDNLVKRYPSGFLGMRGKKAPSGFLGMRGKKSSGEDYLPSTSISRQALLSLLQGDAAPPKDEDYYYYYYNPEAWRAGTHKRAPSGFLGMRGKKDAYPGLAQDKRTPSGFLGMRDKEHHASRRRDPVGVIVGIGACWDCFVKVASCCTPTTPPSPSGIG